MISGRVFITNLLLTSAMILYTSCKSTNKSGDADVKGKGFDQSKMPANAEKIANCQESKGWDPKVPGSSLTMYHAMKNGKHQIWAFGSTKGDGGVREQFSFAGTASKGWTNDKGRTALGFNQAGGVMEFAKPNVPGKKVAGITFYTKENKQDGFDGQKEVTWTIPANSIEFSWDTGGLETMSGSAPGLSPWWERGIMATCQTFPSPTLLKEMGGEDTSNDGLE